MDLELLIAARERLLALPLKGLPNLLRRAERPAAEIEAAEARGDYFLSERQAKAILEMRLSKLTGLEQEKLAQEYGELCNEIARLRTDVRMVVQGGVVRRDDLELAAS